MVKQRDARAEQHPNETKYVRNYMAGLSDAAYDYHNYTELLGMMLFESKGSSTVPADYQDWMNSAPEEMKNFRTQAAEITVTNPR